MIPLHNVLFVQKDSSTTKTSNTTPHYYPKYEIILEKLWDYPFKMFLTGCKSLTRCGLLWLQQQRFTRRPWIQKWAELKCNHPLCSDNVLTGQINFMWTLLKVGEESWNRFNGQWMRWRQIWLDAHILILCWRSCVGKDLDWDLQGRCKCGPICGPSRCCIECTIRPM